MANGQNFPSSLNPGPVGRGLTQPVAPLAGAPPQVDPGIIQKLMMKLQNDPNFRQSLLTTGLTLLGDPQPNESGFGTFSRSALTGVQTLDALRQRDREEGRAEKRVQLDAERTEESRRRTDIAADRTQQAAAQFDERMTLARDQFDENVRQFDESIAAGRFSGTSGTTGQERILSGGVQALVTARPDVYPDTPEGRAKARLVVQGIGEAGNDPLRQAQIMSTLFSDLKGVNPFLDEPLTDEELVRQTTRLFQTFSGAVPQEAGSEGIDDPLNGQVLTLPQGQAVEIVALGGDRFRLMSNGVQSDQVFTREQIERLRQSGSQQ